VKGPVALPVFFSPPETPGNNLPGADEVIELNYTGMKRRESVVRNSRSSTSYEGQAMSRTSKQFVVCVNNEGYSASLEKRKIYVALRDSIAEKHGQLRIIDESGEDYLYPKTFFRAIALPQSIKRAVLAAA
jgi:hypothetical protein